MERRNQQIANIAKDISNSFSSSLILSLNGAVDSFFNDVIKKLKQISAGFSESEQKNSEYLNAVNKIKQTIHG